MENWTEENLVKLSVKELKSLARKSNVNPNNKKAELVKALLTNIKNNSDCEEFENDLTSKRMTRSRISLWKASEKAIDLLKETKSSSKTSENLNESPKASIRLSDKRTRRKTGKTSNNTDAFNASEMFPLVSSIQLVSKPLVEITNKKGGKEELDKPEEFFKASVSSKRSKLGIQSKINDDVLQSINMSGEVSSVVNTILKADRDADRGEDFNNQIFVAKESQASHDLNEKKRSRKRASVEEEQGIKGKDLSSSKPLMEQHTVEVGEDCVKISSEKEIQKHVETPNESSQAPRRGRKRKLPLQSDSAEEKTAVHQDSLQISDKLINDHGCNRSRRKKHVEDVSENKSTAKIDQKPRNSSVNDLHQISKSPKTYDSKSCLEKYPDSEKIMANASVKKKRKMGTSSLPETLSFSSEINSSETIKNKPDIKNNNSMIDAEINNGEKSNKGKNKKRAISLEDICSKNHESKVPVEKSLDHPSPQTVKMSSKDTENLPKSPNKSMSTNCTLFDSGKKSSNDYSSGNTLERIDVSAVKESTEAEARQGPIRSSTFILSDSSATEENTMPVPVTRHSVQQDSTFILTDSGATEENTMPVPVPRHSVQRDSTFILTDSDGNTSQRRSMRFSPRQALGDTSQKAGKLGKSIGHRITKTSWNLGNKNKPKNEKGPSVKKTIMKATKPGSVFKRTPGKRMPDFKKIHQQLFNNMESLSEHKQRLQDRAQEMLQSPIVPRCAIVSPRVIDGGHVAKTPRKPVEKVKTSVAPSPLAIKLKTPQAPRTPGVSRNPVPAPAPSSANRLTSRTPVAVRNTAQLSQSVNRFGFRKPVRKEEATSIIGKKLPSVNVEKKKEVERSVLKGVRMNKRFMLQMQMRQLGKEGDK